MRGRQVLRMPNALPIREACTVLNYAYLTLWKKVQQHQVLAVRDANGCLHIPLKEIERVICERYPPNRVGDGKVARYARRASQKEDVPTWILNRRARHNERYGSDPAYRERHKAMQHRCYQRHKAERLAKAHARYAQKKAEEAQTDE